MTAFIRRCPRCYAASPGHNATCGASRWLDLRTGVLELFVEAHHAWHSWRGESFVVAEWYCVEPESREIEKDNFVAKRRIKTLAEYKRRLLAGERPRGLNLKLWQQAADAIGIKLEATQPKGG